MNNFTIHIKKFLGSIPSEIQLSLFSLLFFVSLYTTISIYIRKQEWGVDKKNKIIATIRNSFFLVFILSLSFIWSGELKTFIFSAAAICSALMIVFKEFILAISGTIITSKTFNVGDYIEYEGFTGKIIDKTFLNTRVLVSSPYNNKELLFPNIHYITNKIINLSTLGKLVTYKLTIGIEGEKNIIQYSNKLNQIANEALEVYKNKYTEHLKERKKDNFNIEPLDVSPKINYDLSDPKKITLTLTYISHPLDQETIEREILNKYLNYISTKEEK